MKQEGASSNRLGSRPGAVSDHSRPGISGARKERGPERSGPQSAS
jgi:hypothetical protein